MGAEKPNDSASAADLRPSTEEPCPLSWDDITRLAASIGIDDPHEGAQSPANVWGVVKAIRARTEQEMGRHELHRLVLASGSDTVDIAIAYLCEEGGFTLRKGKARHNDVLCRPTSTT